MPSQPVPVTAFRPIIVDLGAICGGRSYALAVNAAGAVAGECDVPPPIVDPFFHAALWQNNTWTDLGTLGGGYSTAGALNDAGLVAGRSRMTANLEGRRDWHAVIWNHGVISDLGTVGGSDSYGIGINNSGTVVGTSAISGDLDFVAFLWENGVMTPLASVASTARAINDLGQVVGDIHTTVSTNHAVIWYMGVMTDLGTLGGPSSLAFDINNLGQVVGYSTNAATQTHAFLWANGVMTDLDDLSGPDSPQDSGAYGINNLGQVVGSSDSPEGPSRAVVWDNGVMHELPTLGGPTGEDCLAADISDNGMVVGYCYGLSGRHAVLWDLWDNTSLSLPAIGRQAP